MTEHRFYGELATWWPLVSPPAEYAEEAGQAAVWLESATIAVQEVLELGSGGGHNALHLKERFDLTLVDLSEAMLGISRTLNPTLEHLHGDMRTIRLGRTFDAVFIHDAIDYMVTEEDLRQAAETAFVHCRPGGVVVLVPDSVVESFEPYSTIGGEDGPDGRGVRYLEWAWDPDPTDTWVVSEYSFLLKEADGTVRPDHESHRTGLFPRAFWLQVLTDAGFKPESVIEETTEHRDPREIFIGHRPMSAG